MANFRVNAELLTFRCDVDFLSELFYCLEFNTDIFSIGNLTEE